MPMIARFTCDSCDTSRTLSGNIAKAFDVLSEQGWMLSKVVACPECAVGAEVQTLADSTSENTDKATDANTANISKKLPTVVYSDGSCIGSNPGYGGWGWWSENGEGSGAAETYPSTNQRMEIYAAVDALNNNSNPVVLYTDSRYVVDCVNKKWYVGWIKRGWITSSKEPVKNRDLWEQLVAALKNHPDLEIRWLKGHAGTEGNERADVLARTAAEKGRAAHLSKTSRNS